MLFFRLDTQLVIFQVKIGRKYQKLFSQEIKGQTLFEGRKVAGSAKYKQSKTV